MPLFDQLLCLLSRWCQAFHLPVCLFETALNTFAFRRVWPTCHTVQIISNIPWLLVQQNIGGVGNTKCLMGGGCWDCAGQRRVSEQHTENGSIVPLSTVLDRSSGCLPFAKLLERILCFCRFLLLECCNFLANDWTYRNTWKQITDSRLKNYYNLYVNLAFSFFFSDRRGNKAIKPTQKHLSPTWLWKEPRLKLRLNKTLNLFLSWQTMILWVFFLS